MTILFFGLMSGRVIKSENSSAASQRSQNLNICDETRKKSYFNGTIRGQLTTPPSYSFTPAYGKFCHHDFQFPPSLKFVFDFEEIFLGTDLSDRGRGLRGCNDQDHIHIVSHNGTYQSLGFYCATRKDWDRCVQVPPGSSWVQIQFYAKNKSLAENQIEAQDHFSSSSSSPSSSFKIAFKVANESVCPSPFILTDLLVWGGAAGAALLCFLVLPLILCCKRNGSKGAEKEPVNLSSRPLDASVFESTIHRLDFQSQRDSSSSSIPAIFSPALTHLDETGSTSGVNAGSASGDNPPDVTTSDLNSDPRISLPVRVQPTPSGRRQFFQSELTDDENLPVFFTNLAALKTDAQQQKQQSEDISMTTFKSVRKPVENSRSTPLEDNVYADPISISKKPRRSFLFSNGNGATPLASPSSAGVYTLPMKSGEEKPKKGQVLRQLSIRDSPSEYIARRPEEEYNSPWDDTRETIDAIMPDLVPNQGSVRWHSVAPGTMSDLYVDADEIENKSSSQSGSKESSEEPPSQRPSIDQKLDVNSKQKKHRPKSREDETEDEEKKKGKKKKKKKDKEEKVEKRKTRQSKEEKKSEDASENHDGIKSTGGRTSVVAADPTLEFQSIRDNIFIKQNAIKK